MMKSTSIFLPTSLARELTHAADHEDETAAVLLVGLARTSDGLKLLGRELHWVPDEAYEKRGRDHLQIASSGFVPSLGRAEEIGAAAIFLHTHPALIASPQPSKWDLQVDRDLVETFKIRTGSDFYGSMVISPGARPFRYTARIDDDGEWVAVDRLVVSGDRIVVAGSDTAQPAAVVPPIFDRQVKAFGGAVQSVLSSLRVGVVGCGGTGSAVAEQLVRLGVRDFTLLDDDHLESTNITRLYGSSPSDVGQPKVEVVDRNLITIAPDARVDARVARVTDEQAARSLVACDVIFGCTDDNAGRIALSRLASFYLIPLFDLGVLISSDHGVITSIDGRVTVQTPGAACLICRNRVDLAMAAAEQMSSDELGTRQSEGYAPELGGIEPAVVTFTSSVASQAINELLERLTGFGPELVPTEVLLRFHDREVSTNLRTPRVGHFCDPNGAQLGAGDQTPFLRQLWRTSP